MKALIFFKYFKWVIADYSTYQQSNYIWSFLENVKTFFVTAAIS